MEHSKPVGLWSLNKRGLAFWESGLGMGLLSCSTQSKFGRTKACASRVGIPLTVILPRFTRRSASLLERDSAVAITLERDNSILGKDSGPLARLESFGP